MIRMIGFENSVARLCLDITNYDTIDVRELRSYDEILEDNGARLSELSDDSSNLFGYRWLGSLKSSSSVIALGDTRGSQRKMVAQALPVLNDEDILSIKEMGKYQPDWVYEEWLPVDISRINTRHGRSLYRSISTKTGRGSGSSKTLYPEEPSPEKKLLTSPSGRLKFKRNRRRRTRSQDGDTADLLLWIRS